MIYKAEEYVEECPENPKFPVKHIEVLTPLDGSKKTFVGQVTLGLQTPFGIQQVPISFTIPAETIEEAFREFEKCAEPKIREARQGIEEEIRRLRSEVSRRIVRPDELGLGGGGNIIDFKPRK